MRLPAFPVREDKFVRGAGSQHRAAAEQNTSDFTSRISSRIRQYTLEPACGEFVQGRCHLRVTQQALWGHDNQRFSPSPQNLAPQAVEELDRHGRLDDLNIVVRSQTEKPFQSCAGVLGALALESVGKQNSDAAQPAPFFF